MTYWKDLVRGEAKDLRVAMIGHAEDIQPFLEMFRASGRHEKVRLDLEHVDVPRAEFQPAMDHLASIGFRGAGVSGPLKVDAARVAERFFVSSQSLGVANTLLLENGIWAQNTEVAAFEAMVRPLPPGTALVLGSGAGARSVVGALMHAGWKVRLWNRNSNHARPLLTMMMRYGEVERMPNPDPAGCSLIVNATPVGKRAGEKPPLEWGHIARGSSVVDLVYRRVSTEFLREARSRGLNAIDGRQLLAEQAALSFEWWVGRSISRDPMLEALGLKVARPA